MNYIKACTLLIVITLILNGCVTSTNSSLSKKADPVTAVQRYVQLGLEYIKRDDLQRARKHIKRALSINPNDASANAAISARLPYIMATSRIAHFLKVMARDKIGSFMSASDAEEWLNRWINNYVNGSPGASAEMKAKYPLAEARVEVKEVPGQPGVYNAVAWMRPWLQMEELTASLRLVANIPKAGG